MVENKIKNVKRAAFSLAAFCCLISAYPLISSNDKELDPLTWRKSCYSWEDSRAARSTRAGFWAGLSTLATGLFLTTTKRPISHKATYAGSSFAGTAAGLGLFLYGANSLMQKYRRFLPSDLSQPGRLFMCSEGLRAAFRWCLGKSPIPGDINLNIAFDNFSTWCNALRNANPLAERELRLQPVKVDTLKTYLEKTTEQNLTTLSTYLINPEDVDHGIGKFALSQANELIYTQRDFPFGKSTDQNHKTIYFSWGDLHGDVASLLKSLQHLKCINKNWKITKPDIKLVFCGDFVDRGTYGVEVLLTLLKLKTANPEQVTLVRGNHEDVVLGKNQLRQAKNAGNSSVSFHGQLKSLYKKPPMKSLAQFYGSLPAALFVKAGNDIIQFCHGGIEPAYQPVRLLNYSTPHPHACEVITYNNLLKRTDQYAQYCETIEASKKDTNSPAGKDYQMFQELQNCEGECLISNHTPGQETSIGPLNVGLLWNKFSPDLRSELIMDSGMILGTGFTSCYCKNIVKPTEKILIRCAHQHDSTTIGKHLKKSGFHIINGENFKILTHVTTPIHGYVPQTSYMKHIISPDGLESAEGEQVMVP